MNDNDKSDATFLLGQLVADIKNINTKLDEIRGDIKEDIRNHDSRIDGIEDRLTKVEGWKSTVISIAVSLSFMVSVIWAVADDYVKDKLFHNSTEISISEK